MGDSQQLWPYLKLSTGDLEPPSKVLEGSRNPCSSKHLTDASKQVLAQVEHAIQYQQVCYVYYAKPWETYMLPIPHTTTAVLWQEGPLE